MRFTEEACQEADYFLIQEGADLSRLSEVGFHWTSQKGLREIHRHGLGKPVRYLNEHEIFYAYCLLDGDHARWAEERGQSDDAVEHAFLDQYRGVRSFWFATDPDYEGETAGHREERVVIDLHGAGDWLGRLKTEAWAFTDNAGGWGVYWIGPPLPGRFLRR